MLPDDPGVVSGAEGESSAAEMNRQEKKAKKKRLGDSLVESGLISAFQLQCALGHQRRFGGRLGTCLIRLGFVKEHELVESLSSQFNLPTVDLSEHPPARESMRLLPSEFIEKHTVIPVRTMSSGAHRVLCLAMGDPTRLDVIDEASFITGLEIQPIIASELALSATIRRFFGDRRSNANEVEALEPDDLMSLDPNLVDEEVEIIRSDHQHNIEMRSDARNSSGKEAACVEESLLLESLVEVLVRRGLVTHEEIRREIKKKTGS